MKTDLLVSDPVRCSFYSDFHKICPIDKRKIEIETSGQRETVRWDISGDVYIVWPNREGEGFYLKEAVKKLKLMVNAEMGLSISYPATASMVAFLVKRDDLSGFLFYMDRDDSGKICEIRIISEQEGQLSFNISAEQKKWNFLSYKDGLPDGIYPAVHSSVGSIKRQFQLGLIDPQGKTHVPKRLGFHIIIEIAEQINARFGAEGNNIHIFGYARGHDRMYPDFYPSEFLGGIKALKYALKEIKKRGFESSFYLNGRLLDSEALKQFPQLKKALLYDSQGNIIKEKYYNRTFYVLDPSSSDWENCLIQWARLLAECGADTVQLDQLGGRAALKEPGEIWGEGYNRIIDGIHDLGMKVWIQGVSDYYHADWFEMTYRKLNILEGGILRGGNPFGHTDLSLINVFLADKTFLVTESKKLEIGDSEKYHLILDNPDYKGELPIYDDNYINRLNDVQAALR